ncbi:unnamed protein product [Phytomonas sp. EM1]|nr:unnamed protein product [Phytomonas sp. EM1]|eukprot:CCW65122.1 unnamed protein product [Phytomonas sp. isolate EM1]
MRQNSFDPTHPTGYSLRINNESQTLSTAKKRHGATAFSLTSNGTIAHSKNDEGYSIAAVLNNNVKEIGIAFVEFPSFAISITQFGDTCSYSKLNALLFARNPVEVLLSSTTIHDPFTRLLIERFGAEITFTSIPRKYFDVEDGVVRLNYLKSTQETTLSIEDTDHYLSVASANALVLYVEGVTHMQLLPGSIRVRCISLDNFADISRSTARSLHILPPSSCEGVGRIPLSCPTFHRPPPQQQNNPSVGRGSGRAPKHAADGRVCPTTGLQLGSLMDALPRPRTAMGRRFLRSSILQPLKDRISIQHRHDAVEWLVTDPKRVGILLQQLQHLAEIDLEKITAIIALNPTHPTDESRRRLLVSLLAFWDALDALQSLHRCLRSLLPSSTEVHDEKNAPNSSMRPLLFYQLAQTLESCLLHEILVVFNHFLDPTVRELREQIPRRAAANERTDATEPCASSVFEPYGDTEVRVYGPRRLNFTSHNVLQLMRIGFAIQAPPGSALDVARSALCQQIKSITDYQVQLALRYQLNTLKLEADPDHMFCLSYLGLEEPKTRGGPFIHKYAGSSHYQLYLQALCGLRNEEDTPWRDEETTSAPHLNPLPRTSEAHRKRKPPRVYCTTSELTALCHAAIRWSSDIFEKEVQAAQGLLTVLQTNLGRIQALTEAVALLDMLLSFATYSMINHGSRPLLWDQESGTTTNPHGNESAKSDENNPNGVTFCVLNAYYPSVVSCGASRNMLLVPNSVTWAPEVSVVVLTGPNGAGKSLLLRMIGQIFVLAQCGCFVPAESVELFITDRILAHMLCDDLPSVLCSSQRRELMELAEISNVATSRSVVLIDELGRSMLYTEGFTLAWAAVMWLRSEGIHSLFSTHFAGITEIPHAFPDTTNMHFALEYTERDTNEAAHRTTATISHHLKPGACPDSTYGLQVAMKMGFPIEVLSVARSLYRAHLWETKNMVLLNSSIKP